jgi:hypothetical protein
VPSLIASGATPVTERRFTDIRYWNEPERGGHFAASEHPALFVEEVRRCFRALRAGPR